MAILFDWYELPEPKDKQREEKILHPRIRLNGSTTTDELRRRIQERSSLTETDVSAVLDALSHVMGEDLAEGRQVHLPSLPVKSYPAKGCLLLPSPSQFRPFLQNYVLSCLS